MSAKIMKRMKKETCETCKYRCGDFCRRYPPIPIKYNWSEIPEDWSEIPEGFSEFSYVHPRTYLDNWCGEYKKEESND